MENTHRMYHNVGRYGSAGKPYRLTRSISAFIIVASLCFPIALWGKEGRWVEVGRVSDFRDAGGYPVQGGTVGSGLLYRSDDLSSLDRAGVETLVGLGIKTVVDLRANPEGSARIEELSGRAIKIVHLPIVTDPLRDKNDFYKRMIVNGRGSLTSLLVLLSERDNLPLVIFDEDGIHEVEVAAMFVLLVLGVARDDAVSDYLLSNQRGAGLQRQWGEIIVRYFDEYGGMEYYTTKILGLDTGLISAIRNNLIEK